MAPLGLGIGTCGAFLVALPAGPGVLGAAVEVSATQRHAELFQPVVTGEMGEKNGKYRNFHRIVADMCQWFKSIK